MPPLTLDNNERAMLNAYDEQDPDAESWICPWALPAASLLGADSLALTFHGTMAVARRLCSRKLLDGEPNARGRHRGYAINDKGREALRP